MRLKPHTLAALIAAITFFWGAQFLRAALTPAPSAAFVVEEAGGIPDAVSSRFAAALRAELIRRGHHDDKAERVIGLVVWVGIGEPQDGKRLVTIDWKVRDGATGKRLGTVRQTNHVPADIDEAVLWNAIMGDGIEAAVRGLVKLSSGAAS